MEGKLMAGTTIKSLSFNIGGAIDNAINRQISRLDRQINDLQGEATQLRNAFLFLSFGLLATGGLLTRFGNQLKDMADTARDAFASVDWSASIVSTTMTGTNEVAAEVREEMVRLGVETQWTAREAGDAMQRLALAGFNTAEAMGSTEAVLRLATIGLTDTTTAANLAVGVFRGFTYEVDNAAQASVMMSGIVSELAYAATNSATTVEELGEALKFAAASADLVGWSLEEVTAVLMVSADNMVRAGIAGRALRRSFVQMNKLALQQQGITMSGSDAMEKYSIELLDADGNMKGMIETVEELHRALDGLAKAERNAALAAMFGTRAITMWSAIMKVDPEILKEREFNLKVAAAKDMLFAHGIEDSTEQMLKWGKEADKNKDYIAWFTEEMDASIDEAILMSDVIKELSGDFEVLSENVRSVARASDMTEERLKTLHGTMLLLQSSVDAMWVSIGEQLKPLLIWWNQVMKSIADSIKMLPAPIRLLIGVIILLGAVFFVIIGKVLTMVGSFMMLVAAIHMLRQEKYKDLEASTLMVMGMKILKKELWLTTLATKKLVWQKRMLGLQIAMNVAIMYGALISYKNTGNQLYLLIIAVQIAWGAYKLLNTSKKANIMLTLRSARTYVIFNALLVESTIRTHASTLATRINTGAHRIANVIRYNSITLQLHAIALSIREKLAMIASTIARVIHTAVLWVETSAWWALTAAMYANPMMWIVLLVMALVVAMILLWQNIDKVREFFQQLWDTIVGFFEAVGGALEDFRDMLGGLIGHSVIPDYFARGAREIGQSLDTLESNATGTLRRLRTGLDTTFAPEINARGMAAGGTRHVAMVNNNFGGITVGSMQDAEELGDIIDTHTRRTLRRLEFELGTAEEEV